MTSSIDPTKPAAVAATTQSVRDNFTVAKAEIEALQAGTAFDFVQAGAGAVSRTGLAKLRDTVHIKDFGAVCDGVADDTAEVLAAVAALSAGGTLYYSGTPLLSSTVTIDKPIRLVGVGRYGVTPVGRPGSYFIKKATMTTPAITVTHDGAVMDGGGVVGQVGNTGDNILINGNSILCLGVYSEAAGQDGFRRGTDAGLNNCNACSFIMCHAHSNIRRGFYDRDGGSDNNVGTYLACVAHDNGEDGFRNGTTSGAQGSNNKFINCIGENNTGQGINIVGGAGNMIDGGDYESNAAGQVLIGVDAVGTVLLNLRNAFTLVDNSTTTENLCGLIQKQGTWTPVLAGSSTPGTQTYGEQVGRYVRAGNMLFVTFRITLSAKDGATAGSMRITGLPFIYPSAFTNGIAAVSIGQWGVITFPANFTMLCGEILPNTQYISLTRAGSAQGAAFVAAAEVAATSQVYGSAWYPIVSA